MNFELNITLKCNYTCANCNRMCDIFRDREEFMSVEQVKRFIEQIKASGGIGKLKVIGGEPLLHPNFVEIYNLLADAQVEGFIKTLKVDTNSSLPRPEGLKSCNSCRWLSTKVPKKVHYPYVWDPCDKGWECVGPCPGVGRCGISLDKYGYLPCSPAIMIVRLYGLTHLYKTEIPKQMWGMDEICKHCISGLKDRDLLVSHCKHIKDMVEEKVPTVTMKNKIEAWKNCGQELFYKSQKEF